jgi:uncharacterized protein YdbL (DUF1318 family)
MPSRSLETVAISPSARRRRGGAAFVAGLLAPALFAMACVTVNIYFPAPEVREAAEKIVDETWGGATPPAPGKQSSLAGRMLLAAALVLSPREAEAAAVNVDVSTAAIRALKDGMKQRASELKPHLSSGAVGIGKDGLLVVRDAAALDLASKARVKRLVDAENKDREDLYKEIATANDFGAERVADIRSIFSQTWKDKAEPGWWIQSAAGAWSQK